MHYNPRIAKGIVKISFDLRLEPGAVFVHEQRDWRGEPYAVGPSLRFVAEGELTANGREVTTVPARKWVHVEIVCPVGRNAARAYDLSITIEGRQSIQVKGIPISSEAFRQLTWVGFISDATVSTAAYLDNVKLTVAAAQ
jgi:hypothetical protein